MNRREFFQCAAALAAGSSMLPSSWAMTLEQQDFLAAQPDYIDRHPLNFFTQRQRAAVTAVAEQIIPATDTPGAVAARAPRFIELMVANWLNDTERAFFVDGLTDLQQRAGGDFAALAAAGQLLLLEQLEEEAGDAAWFQMGNVTRLWDDTAPFICQVKELTVLGFMLSDVGSSEFLRVNPMGSFEGDIPLTEDDSSYAVELPIRAMAGGEVL